MEKEDEDKQFVIYVFDVVELNGVDLLKSPLI